MAQVLSELLNEDMQKDVIEPEAITLIDKSNEATTAPVENPPMGGFSERSIRPLLKEKDIEIRAEAIRRSALVIERKKKEFGKDKANVTAKDMESIIKEVKKEFIPEPEVRQVIEDVRKVVTYSPVLYKQSVT